MVFRQVHVLFWCCASMACAQNPEEFFEKRVRPVLAEHCYACHTTSKLGGLQIDTREAMIKGGKTGPAIVPGKPGESLLIKAVNQTDPQLKMPMTGPR